MSLREADHVCSGSYCADRQSMPQVDEKDMSALLGHFIERGVSFTGTKIDPLDLRSHQTVEAKRALEMPDFILAKPILISGDMWIIDGNHRRMGHLYRGSRCPCLIVNLNFEVAVEMIFQCPCVYSYGDGRKHPWSY